MQRANSACYERLSRSVSFSARARAVCVCVCVYWFLWFTGTQICLITWVWQRYYNLKVFYEDTAYVPVIQKA